MSDEHKEELPDPDAFEKENYMDSGKKTAAQDLFPGKVTQVEQLNHCLLYTSDAADE